jgi:hypothetical protein
MHQNARMESAPLKCTLLIREQNMGTIFIDGKGVIACINIIFKGY